MPILPQLIDTLTGDVYADLGGGNQQLVGHLPVPPALLARPTITGTPAVGAVVALAAGTANPDGMPVASAQTQLRQREGSTVTLLLDNPGPSYTIPAGLDGVDALYTSTRFLGVNGQWSDWFDAVPIGPIENVVAEPPVLNTAPAITGTAQQGETLTATPATWTGETVASVQRQWRRGGVTIAGASGVTYVPQAADVGATLTVRERATGGNGMVSGWAESAATATVTAWLPILTGASFAADPINVGDTVSLTLQFARLSPSVSQSVTVAFAKDPELTGPSSQSVTVTADAFGVASTTVNFTAASAGDAAVTATLNGSSVDDTVSIAATLTDYTETFTGADLTRYDTLPGVVVLGDQTQAAHLVLDGAGNNKWTTTTGDSAIPGKTLFARDAGSNSMEVEFVMPALPTAAAYIALCCSAVNNGLRVEIPANGVNFKLQTVVGTTATTVINWNAVGMAAGDTMRVRVRLDTAGALDDAQLYKNGVQIAGGGSTADISAVTPGPYYGISSQGRRGIYTSLRGIALAPSVLLSAAVVDKAVTTEGQAVGVDETTELAVHVTGLTPSVSQPVALEVLGGSLLGDVCVAGQAVTKTVTASEQGTAWVMLRLRGHGSGQQAVSVRSSINTLTTQMHAVQCTGVTMPATATVEDPLRVELAFAGLPPGMSQRIPVRVTAPAGLYVHRSADHVMVRADSSGNGVGVLGGFAAAAGAHALQIEVCGQTYTAGCTVAALDLSAALRMSDPATYGGAFPAAGADVTLPAGLLLWDLATMPNWGRLTVPADCRVYSDDSIQHLRLSVREMLIAGHTDFSRRGRFVVGRAGAHRGVNTSAVIEATGALPALTPIVLPGGLSGGGFFTTDLSRSISIKGDFVCHGYEHSKTWTLLAATAAAGSNTLVLEDAVTWPEGSQISVGISEFYALSGQSETHVIQAISPDGKTLTLQGTLGRRRWGQKTYATNTTAKATAPGAVDQLHPQCQTVLRDQASVSLLSMPITVQGKDDAHWTNGWGVTTICHERDSAYWLTGTQFLRYGAKAKEHYAYHSHFMSFAHAVGDGDFAVSTGAYLGDPAHSQVHGCSFDAGAHRAWTQHATTGSRFTNSVVRRSRGHALMQEEGAEFNLSLSRVLVQDVLPPFAGFEILESDKETPVDATGQPLGPAGFWHTNPQISVSDCRFESCIIGKWNAFSEPIKPLTDAITKPSTVTVNLARCAAEGTLTLTATSATQMTLSGITTGTLTKGVAFTDALVTITITGTWAAGNTVTIPVVKAYTGGCLGLSSRIAEIPFHMPTVWDRGNSVVFNKYTNMISGFNAADEAGNVLVGRFAPTRTGRPDGAALPFILADYQLHGGSEGNYGNQVMAPHYLRFMTAGWVGTSTFGATLEGAGGRADFFTVVGRPLRMTAEEIAIQAARPVCAFASYHDTVDIAYPMVFHIPANPIPERAIFSNRRTQNHSGLVLMDDLYVGMHPHQWFDRWFGVRQVDVAAAQRTPSPYLETPDGFGWPGYIGQDGTPGEGQDVLLNKYRRWAVVSFVPNMHRIFVPAAPADAFLSFDHPFFTHGLSAYSQTVAGGRTIWTQNKHFGCRVMATDTMVASVALPNREGMFVERFDSAGVVVGRLTQKNSNTSDSNVLPNFHSFGVRADALARYRVYNGETTAIYSTVFCLECEAANAVGYQTVFEVPWSGSVPAKVHLGPAVGVSTGVASGAALTAGTAVAATAVASYAAVLATPNSFWQDTAGNRVVWRADGGIGPSPKLSDSYAMGVTPA